MPICLQNLIKQLGRPRKKITPELWNRPSRSLNNGTGITQLIMHSALKLQHIIGSYFNSKYFCLVSGLRFPWNCGTMPKGLADSGTSSLQKVSAQSSSMFLFYFMEPELSFSGILKP